MHPLNITQLLCPIRGFSPRQDIQRLIEEDEDEDLGYLIEETDQKEIMSWNKSFASMMESNRGRKIFKVFLRKEYSDENISFWSACEDLKKEVDPELVEEKARTIYEDYISILSPREVSLDSEARDIINKKMKTPSSDTFNEAQIQIFNLMKRDSYPRFINSFSYKLLPKTKKKLSFEDN